MPQQPIRYAYNPNRAALLDTIRHAEGTLDRGDAGYGLTFGYQTFDPSKGHPRRVVRSGGYASDAAGAFQFLSTTWDETNSQMGGNLRFDPEGQRQAALHRADWRLRNAGLGGLPYIDKHGLTPQAAKALGKEWASFPGSPYGQPTKGLGDIQRVYGERRGAYAKNGIRWNAGGGAAGGGAAGAGAGGGGGGLIAPSMAPLDRWTPGSRMGHGADAGASPTATGAIAASAIGASASDDGDGTALTAGLLQGDDSYQAMAASQQAALQERLDAQLNAPSASAAMARALQAASSNRQRADEQIERATQRRQGSAGNSRQIAAAVAAGLGPDPLAMLGSSAAARLLSGA